MNKFKKYCPNVWVAECDDEYEKGDIIELETKYGKLVECEVYNLIEEKDDKYYYSIVRLDESYAQRRAERHMNRAAAHHEKSNGYYEASLEGQEFLALGEPIKVGHHSEKRHRSLIERNCARMEKSVEASRKAEEAEAKTEYWERKAKEITLAMPESLSYFWKKLLEAKEYHQGLKDGTIERTHSYSMTYAREAVNDYAKKVEIAELLWGERG